MLTHPWWEKLDYASIEPKIYMKGRDRYITKFGCIMSILSFLSIMVLSGYFIKIFFEMKEVNVLYFLETKSFEPFMDLNKQPFFFNLRDVNDQPVDPRLASIVPTFWLKTNTSTRVIVLETEACDKSQLLKQPHYQNMFQFDLSPYQCIKSDLYNLNLTLDMDSGIKTYFNLYITECTNSTENNNFCFSRDKIKLDLSNLNFYFKYFFPSYTIDHYNQTNPLSESFFSYQVRMYYSYFYTYYENIKTVNYTSDDGLVFQDVKNYHINGRDDVHSYYKLSPLETTTFVEKTFSQFQIQILNNQIDQYKRSYPKFQSVLANIGGVMKFILSFAQFIAKFVTSQMKDIELSNAFVFHHSNNNDENEENEEKENEDCKNNKIFVQGVKGVNSNSKQVSDNTTCKELNINNLNNLKDININKVSKLPFFKHLIINQIKNLRKTTIPKTEIKTLSWLETILPRKCFSKKSAIHIVDKCQLIIKRKLSSDYILKTISEFEKLKTILLDEKQNVVFMHMKNPSIDEYLKILFPEKEIDSRLPSRSLTSLEVENLIEELKLRDDRISKSLVDKFEEKII